MNKKQFGFSLVELSIVIVIIGLLVAAATQGKGLLESARVRSIISEFTEHKLSAESFKLKYGKYPGDFNEAGANWGATSNGDADGKIEFVASTVYEGYRAWQHLTYAKMTKAVYSGTLTTAAAQLEIDIPKSAQTGGYVFENGILGLTGKNVIALGTPLASTTTISLGGTITPKQGLSIDNKTDGGNPSTGSIRAIDGNGSVANSCVTATPIYNISNEGKNCVIGLAISN
jgi:prepilin-type N-terminal cleavage/methylation domain-containing protein